jgi:hypothetical protein
VGEETARAWTSVTSAKLMGEAENLPVHSCSRVHRLHRHGWTTHPPADLRISTAPEGRKRSRVGDLTTGNIPSTTGWANPRNAMPGPIPDPYRKGTSTVIPQPATDTNPTAAESYPNEDRTVAPELRCVVCGRDGAPKRKDDTRKRNDAVRVQGTRGRKAQTVQRARAGGIV